MRFVIVGAGAIGGVVGGQLAKAGFDVVFVDKLREHVDAINRDGLRLKGVHGAHTLRIPAVSEVGAVGLRPDDVVVLSVKSFHTDRACQEITRATTLDLPIFCAQNGVRNEETAARYFREVDGVMVLIGAKRLVPGEVVHTAKGPVGIGTYPSGLSEAAREAAAALGKTDIPVYTTERIPAHKWHKMLVNLNNATFGLTGLSGEEARADPEVAAWMADVYEEGVRVVRAAGIPCEGPPGAPAIEDRIRELRKPSAPVVVPPDEERKHRPSLWQDLYHRTGEVEADAFNGEIVRLGREHGVPTPYSGLLFALIGELAARRAGPGSYTIRELQARLGSGGSG
jgi:2-dehydropantoate 2-reductase